MDAEAAGLLARSADEAVFAQDPATDAEAVEFWRIVDEQRGSDVSQAFVIRSMLVDTKSLTASVTGTLKTFVGAQVIASQERTFRFAWAKRGLSLGLPALLQCRWGGRGRAHRRKPRTRDPCHTLGP